MARRLGEAFVSIEADASLFRASAIAGMKKALAGVTGNIKVTADMDHKKADQAIAALKLRMEGLSQTLAKMRASVDTKSAEASIVKLQTELHGLAKNVSKMTFNADTSKLDAAILKEQRELARLQKQASSGLDLAANTAKMDAAIARETAELYKFQKLASNLRVDADVTKMDAKLASLAKETSVINKRLKKLKADVDIDKALTRLYAIEAEIELINSDARKIEFLANTNKFNAAIEASRAKLASLEQEKIDLVANMDKFNAAIEASRARIKSLEQEKIDLTANIDVGALLGAERRMLGLEAATSKMADTTERATKAGGAFQGVWTGGWLRGAILGIGIWHIALDALLEAIIVVTAASAALAAGVAAMSESARNLGTHMKGVQVASSALGVDIPPLTGKFDDLMTAMAPRTIEAFGGGLELIKSQAGGILARMEPVVNLFDTWIAKIDIWAAHERDFGTIINAGREFLEQLGKAVGILADAITNLLEKDPGIAHFLLDFLQGALLLLDAFSKLPAPIVEATLAIHGAYLWLKLLVAVPLLSFAKSLGILSAAQLEAAGSALKFQNILKFLIFNPFGWATIAAVAIGYLAYQMTQATGKAKNFIGTLEQGLSSLSASQAISQISFDIGQLRAQIDQVPARVGTLETSVTDFAAKAGKSFNDVSADLNRGDINSALVDIGKSAYNTVRAFFGWQSIGPQIIQTKNDVAEFKGEIITLTGEQERLFHVTGLLVTGQNELHLGSLSVTQAFALMDLAGVKASDSFEVQWQKVKNLVTGYETLSIRGGILENSVNAISFAALQQQEKVTQLNSAWDTFFKTVSGGETGFLSFAQQTIGLFRVLGGGAVKMAESNGKVRVSMSGLADASKDTAVSMLGLNDASINARNTFLASASAANDQIGNLTLLANAAGLGEKGTRLLERATQDMVAALLPATGGSKALTDVLYVLAQRGGYHGANSFKELTKWVGKVQNPMKDLDSITTTLTTDASNLTEDVKNLSIALGQTLNDAMAAAILQATGGQQAFDDFANQVLHGTKNSKAMQDAALTLANQLIGLTGNTKDAHDEFDTFAQQMGLSRDDADKLWAEISGKLTPALANQKDKILPGIEKAFMKFAENGLVGTEGAATTLWTQIVNKLGPSMDSLGNLAAGPVKKKFIDWAMNSLHLSKAKATELWKEVVILQAHIDALHGKTVNVGVKGVASGGINLFPTPTGAAPKSSLFFKPLARGGRLDGFGGGDSVPAMLEPGEAVIDKHRTKVLAPLFGQMGVPGFAKGGLIGIADALAPFQDTTAALTQQKTAKMMLAAINAMVAWTRKHAVGTGASVLAYAESFKGKVPYVWGGATPAGWDCSGFVSYVLKHFHLLGARMDAQGLQNWARPAAPTPGGMAFYGNPAHHVGFVVDKNTLLSALHHGTNTVESNINMGDNSGYGIPPGGFGGGGPGGALSGSKLQELAFSMLQQRGWGVQWPAFNSLEVREAGWNMFAKNPASGAYGLAQFINGPSEYYQYGGNPNSASGQLTGMMNYIAQRYGDPNAAWAHEIGFNWYNKGGRVQHMAGGGVVGLQKKLKTLEHREGVDYLGLSKAFWSGPKKFLTGLTKSELSTLKQRQAASQSVFSLMNRSLANISDVNLKKLRSVTLAEQRTAGDKALNRTPGGHPGWASGLRYWLGQLAGLGAPSKGGPAGTVGLSSVLPAVKHTYGGDVGDRIAAFLAGSVGPLGMAQGGMVRSYDSGGYLPPGLSIAHNGTGRPEPVGAVPITINIEIGSTGNATFDQLMLMWMKKTVKVNGGGDAQTAFGTSNIKFVRR